MSTRFCFIKNWPIVIVLICVGMMIGCAGFQKQGPDTVPEIMPGVLAGYLKPEALPNSLALLPPPPAEGSAARSLDEEVSRKSHPARHAAMDGRNPGCGNEVSGSSRHLQLRPGNSHH